MTRSAPAATYDDDFFAWTQEQAAALRGLPREVVGEMVDVEHVAEEIEDLGKRDLREVLSSLARAIEHLMKIDSSPGARDVPHWGAEARLFQAQGLDAFSRGMRRVIDLDTIWKRTRKRTAANLDVLGVVLVAPADCPFTIDELLGEDLDREAALAKLAASRSDGA